MISQRQSEVMACGGWSTSFDFNGSSSEMTHWIIHYVGLKESALKHSGRQGLLRQDVG